MPDNKAIVEMDDAQVIAAARAKLHELSLCDLRFAWPRLVKIFAGGPVEVGSSHEATRQHIRALLADIENSRPEPDQETKGSV